jgi:hypothetical protein
MRSRIEESAVTDTDRQPSATRALVWTLLVLCTVGNLALSIYGGPLAAHAGLGVATVACIAALVAPYFRRRS